METLSTTDEQKIVTLIREDFANLFQVAYDGEYYFFNILNGLYVKNFNNIAPSYFKYYQVQAGDTWTSLSYNFYGTIELWWIICKINGIVNPLEMPIEGQMLKILNSTVVYQILTQMQQSG